MSRKEAASRLAIQIGSLYPLLWSGAIEDTKPEDRRWLVLLASVEARLTRIAEREQRGQRARNGSSATVAS